jgi:hypothetical protein
MRDLKFIISLEQSDNKTTQTVGAFHLDIEDAINAVVDNAHPKDIIEALKKRFMSNAANADTPERRRFHENDLRDFLNLLKG